MAFIEWMIDTTNNSWGIPLGSVLIILAVAAIGTLIEKIHEN